MEKINYFLSSERNRNILKVVSMVLMLGLVSVGNPITDESLPGTSMF